jgi:hypothetical protein
MKGRPAKYPPRYRCTVKGHILIDTYDKRNADRVYHLNVKLNPKEHYVLAKIRILKEHIPTRWMRIIPISV